MRSRGSVGNDSRVSVADWVSMAAILPGPVQAWPRPGPAPECGLTLKGSSRMQSRKSADTLTEQNRSSQCRQPQACGCPPCYLADELCQQLTLLFSSEHVKLNHMDFLIFNVADLKKMTISCFFFLSSNLHHPSSALSEDHDLTTFFQ